MLPMAIHLVELKYGQGSYSHYQQHIENEFNTSCPLQYVEEYFEVQYAILDRQLAAEKFLGIVDNSSIIPDDL